MTSEEKADLNRTFLSQAYLVELENGLFGLYRNLEVETGESNSDGTSVREKIKSIGPIKLLRKAREGEEQFVVLRTYDESSGTLLDLVEMEGT